MSASLTLVLLILALALCVFAGWRGARPLDLTQGARMGPRMAPWRFLMMLSGAFAVLLLIHMASLMGLRR